MGAGGHRAPIEESAERLHWALQGPLPLTDSHCTPAGEKQQAAMHSAVCRPLWCCRVLPGAAMIFSPLDPCLHCRIFTRGRGWGWGEFMVRAHPRTENSGQPAAARSTGSSGSVKEPHFVSVKGNSVSVPHVPQSRCRT